MASQAMYASGSQTQRRLVTSELHNEEAVVHSLSRGDSVLTTAPIPIHNLLHSPTALALRCRDQLLAARFVFKLKPLLPFRPAGPLVGEVVRSTPLHAPGLVLAARNGVGWRALRVLPRLVFWPHCVY
jgi:hypothetical protein